ncbi:MAG: DNA polymerase III subunit gamma/tau [bacterium]|nr:DNA polymerase III subunit gamma/tau [bacterium]
MAEALYRKYRPKSFDDVTGQAHIVTTLKNQLQSGTIAHAYLFSGPRGVGKTTLARLLAHAVNGEMPGEGRSMFITEIDAASHTGVDSVREHVIEAVRFSPGEGKWRVFVIDEVHMLSTSAFNALLKTIEEPPEHALFILATTEVHKIPATILSRCQRFNFHRIGLHDMSARLKMLAVNEGVQVDEDVLAQICRLSEGCLRDAESLLGQVLALGDTRITMNEASLILPVTHLETVLGIVDAIADRRLSDGLRVLTAYTEEGGSVRHLMDELLDMGRSFLFMTIGGEIPDKYDVGTLDAMRGIAAKLNASRVEAILDAILHARNRIGHDLFPQLPLEIAIANLCSQTAQLGKVEAADMGDKAAERTAEKRDESRNSPNLSIEETQKVAMSSEQDLGFEPAKTPGTLEGKIAEIKLKWGRCTRAMKKRNIALPLALHSSTILGEKEGAMEVGFDSSFHFENMNTPKNKEILEAAIKEVTTYDIQVICRDLQAEREAPMQELASAFGGRVV